VGINRLCIASFLKQTLILDGTINNMAKVKKTAVKIVKKKWVPMYASQEFNKQRIGETYVLNTVDALHKPITVNLMTLTMDPKKQNISISFVAEKIEGDGAHCRCIGYKMSAVSLKKIIRRNRTKIGDSFTVSTKDGKKIRIKPLFVTRTHASKPTCTEIRKKARAFIALSLRKLTYSQFVIEVVQRRFQKRLQDLLKKIYPLSICDIRAFYVIEEKQKFTKAPAESEQSVKKASEATTA